MLPKNSQKAKKTNQIKVLGVKISLISLVDALSLLAQWIKSNKKHQISTPNPEQIVLAGHNKAFLRVLNQSNLCLLDGAGLEWAINKNLKIKNAKLKVERIPGIDFMLAACQLAVQKKWRVFLLGGKKGSASQAAVKLRQQYPGLQVASWQGAENIKKESRKDNKLAVEQINRFRPHLLFVAYGAPQQELWIKRNLPKLKVKVAMSVGGALDYISGNVKRAPIWARKIGLEWWFRLIHQPRRLPRQLQLLRFLWLVLRGGGKLT